ncbi:filamin-B-like [Pollicipes pollicipes]|nr:filamin-B-like [Pollicipes pollicipes]
MSDDDDFHISQSGLVARSPEGHAARGMQIKGNEDVWIEIQAHTFKNWVNEKLVPSGLQVNDLANDLCDGVCLVTLVEILQKKKLRKISRPMNQHQWLENVATALRAIEQDGIKLVNIGNVDIVNGNQKLILGLIWSLIMKYQIGQSKFPPKKLMLSWLQGVLPDCRVNNFTTDWNSGVNLNALVDYCKPGLAPNWKNLDPRKGVENNRSAMSLAKKHFGIPTVLDPEYLASPYIDELSGMTYLSYFMNKDGPGYKSTLDWVRQELPDEKINNFTTDWNDGIKLNKLIRNHGGRVPPPETLRRHPDHWEDNLQKAVDAGTRLGVPPPLMKPRDLADPEVDYIGPMSYVARYMWLPRREVPQQQLRAVCTTKAVRVGEPVTFRLDFLDGSPVDPADLRVDVLGPGSRSGRVQMRPDDSGITCTFTPDEMGMHQVRVYHEKDLVDGCPFSVRAVPLIKLTPRPSGIDPCALGSTVEVLINPTEASDGRIIVTAYSPLHRPLDCPVSCTDGVYSAKFQPDEVGEWKIHVTYEGQHIQGSPFNCFVYDPHAVRVGELEGTEPDRPFTFMVDARDAGWGEARTDIVWEARSLPHTLTEIEKDLYRVTVTPPDYGK